MKLKLPEFLRNRLDDLQTSDWEKKYHTIIIFLFLSFVIPIFTAFGIRNVLKKIYLVAFFNLSSAALLLILLFLLFFLKKKNVVFITTQFVLTFSVSALLFLGGENGSFIFWFLFTPLISFVLLSLRWAFASTGLSYIVIGMVLFNIPVMGIYPYAYASGIKLRFVITYSLLVLFAFMYELVRKRHRKEIENEHNRLLESHKIIQQLSLLDPLTNCYNRLYFDSQLKSELARSRRYHCSFSLIMCDIDHFKNVNDTYGHQVGDEVLKIFGNILKSSTRQNLDSIVRFGGEEFFVIAPETTYPGAIILAERIRVSIKNQPMPVADGSFNITASFGVLFLEAKDLNNTTIDKILFVVDKYLYMAKNKGRDCVVSGSLTKVMEE